PHGDRVLAVREGPLRGAGLRRAVHVEQTVRLPLHIAELREDVTADLIVKADARGLVAVRDQLGVMQLTDQLVPGAEHILEPQRAETRKQPGALCRPESPVRTESEPPRLLPGVVLVERMRKTPVAELREHERLLTRAFGI